MNIVDPIDCVVSMLISIIVFAVTDSIPMDDWDRVILIVCVYVVLLLLRQIHRLGGFNNLSVDLPRFPKNSRTDEILRLKKEIEYLRSQLPPHSPQTPPLRRGTPEVRANIRQGSHRVGG